MKISFLGRYLVEINNFRLEIAFALTVGIVVSRDFQWKCLFSGRP
jgi:hypothetical protein